MESRRNFMNGCFHEGKNYFLVNSDRFSVQSDQFSVLSEQWSVLSEQCRKLIYAQIANEIYFMAKISFALVIHAGIFVVLKI